MCVGVRKGNRARDGVCVCVCVWVRKTAERACQELQRSVGVWERQCAREHAKERERARESTRERETERERVRVRERAREREKLLNEHVNRSNIWLCVWEGL